MRFTLFAALMLATVALAGCSDEPPSGDFVSSGNGLSTEGHVHSNNYVSYESPLAGSPAGPATGATGECPFDSQPAQGDPIYGTYRCTHPESELNYMLTVLNDAGAGSWSMGLYVEEDGPVDVTTTAVTADGNGGGYWNTSSDDENLRETFNKVGLFITAGSQTYLYAASGIDSSSDMLVVEPAFTAISYTADYSDKELTVTVAGLDETAPLMIEGWLVTIDDDGVKTHEEMVPLSGNGEQAVYKAEKSIDSYDAFHIHLAGTSLNLATGDIA